jgi:hypothetical protein
VGSAGLGFRAAAIHLGNTPFDKINAQGVDKTRKVASMHFFIISNCTNSKTGQDGFAELKKGKREQI